MLLRWLYMIRCRCKKNSWFVALLATSGLTARGAATSFSVAAPEPFRQVEFAWRSPSGTSATAGVLLLIPGFNSSGAALLDGRWAQFADECGLLLLAPTFQRSFPPCGSACPRARWRRSGPRKSERKQFNRSKRRKRRLQGNRRSTQMDADKEED